MSGIWCQPGISAEKGDAMPSDLVARKIDAFFRIFDFNQDGHLDRSDWEQVVQAVAAIAGKSDLADSQGATDPFWSFIVEMDADGDSRVTPEEFRKGVSRCVRDDETFDRVLGPVAGLWFDLQDIDGDGEISLAEYVKGILPFAGSEEGLTEAFAKLDLNGDGVITKDEFVYLFRDYCGNEDPEAPSNWLLGSVAGG